MQGAIPIISLLNCVTLVSLLLEVGNKGRRQQPVRPLAMLFSCSPKDMAIASSESANKRNWRSSGTATDSSEEEEPQYDIADCTKTWTPSQRKEMASRQSIAACENSVPTETGEWEL